MDLDQQILQILHGRIGREQPVTISDFARRFGASPQVIVSAARRLIDHDLARPSIIPVKGVPTLHGLLPLLAAPVAGAVAAAVAE
jgi:hypothetical protein